MRSVVWVCFGLWASLLLGRRARYNYPGLPRKPYARLPQHLQGKPARTNAPSPARNVLVAPTVRPARTDVIEEVVVVVQEEALADVSSPSLDYAATVTATVTEVDPDLTATVQTTRTITYDQWV